MKITIEIEGRSVSISGNDDESLTGLMDDIIIPAVIAFGYHPDNMDDYFCGKVAGVNDETD